MPDESMIDLGKSIRASFCTSLTSTNIDLTYVTNRGHTLEYYIEALVTINSKERKTWDEKFKFSIPSKYANFGIVP